MAKAQEVAIGKRIANAVYKSGRRGQEAMDAICDLATEAISNHEADGAQDLPSERIYDIAVKEAQRLGI